MLLRDAAPRVLAGLLRRSSDFAAAEDAVQEALLAAARQWPGEGLPDNPVAWLSEVAHRRLVDELRSNQARRDREERVGAVDRVGVAASHDDTAILMLMCCHPRLPDQSAVALTLRAVGGLSTGEIANAFLVPLPTMAQRISRAKQTLRRADAVFELPGPDELPDRLRLVLHVLYLIFNEGYLATEGPQLARTDLSREAIRLARLVRAALPADREVAGLLALMLLTEARRPSRVGDNGELVPLAEQDRTGWDRKLIDEGVALIDEVWDRGRPGAYLIQAAIAAVHDQAEHNDDTDWPRILALYEDLQRLTPSPVVALNMAVATAMVHGPAAGLDALDQLEGKLSETHRVDAVRGHLLEMLGDTAAAIQSFRTAAAATASVPEQHYLLLHAARLAGRRASGPTP